MLLRDTHTDWHILIHARVAMTFGVEGSQALSAGANGLVARLAHQWGANLTRPKLMRVDVGVRHEPTGLELYDV